MNEIDYKTKAERFCESVSEFSENRIRDKEDLSRVIELIYKRKEENLLEDLSFSAKYLQGLIRIIKKTDHEFEKEYFEKIKKEYAENIEKIRAALSMLLEDSSGFIRNIFEDKYLSMNHQSLANLNRLIEDLSWVKMYLNDKKREGSNR